MTVATFPPPSPRQMLECAERELAMRERVYPNQVRSGKMRQREADYEIHVMRGIAEKIRQSIERKAKGTVEA